jgi:hypothetical protein
MRVIKIQCEFQTSKENVSESVCEEENKVVSFNFLGALHMKNEK